MNISWRLIWWMLEKPLSVLVRVGTELVSPWCLESGISFLRTEGGWTRFFVMGLRGSGSRVYAFVRPS